MSATPVRTLLDPLIDQNPITVQILGICSALAVTRTLATALLMSAAVVGVLTLSNVAISVIRHQVPRSIRLIIEITIISSLVIVTDQLLRAYFYELSQKLSVFVGLIVTNCIVLGRAESFAMHHGVRPSLMDGLGNGFGYAAILVTIGATRELLGFGTLLGRTVLPLASEGGWYLPMGLLLLPPSAFFLIGAIIWALRTWRVEQVEPLEHPRARARPEARS